MNWRHALKPWLPPALIQAYRASRGDPRASPAWTLPRRGLAEVFSQTEANITLPLRQIASRDEWAVPTAELVTLAALCTLLQPRQVFEIGTYTGESTRVIARNTRSDAVIDTLDLEPAEFQRRYGRTPPFVAGAAFHNTSEAAKIRQRFLGAQPFDFRPYHGQCDLVFVDGDHRYEAVRADSLQAFQLLSPHGVIVWDDYRWNDNHPECAGVTRCLNELAHRYPIVQLAGTRFALYTPSTPVQNTSSEFRGQSYIRTLNSEL